MRSAIAITSLLFFCSPWLACGESESSNDADEVSSRDDDEDSSGDADPSGDAGASETDDDQTWSSGGQASGSDQAPGTGQAPSCNGVLARAESCFSDALTNENLQELSALAEECQLGFDTLEGQELEELEECVSCLADVLDECKPERFASQVAVRECETCDYWGWLVSYDLPRSLEPVLCEDPEREVCDGEDNDCDGEADDHFVCPDDRVSDPIPSESAVYAVVRRTSCGDSRVHAVWPEPDPEGLKFSCPEYSVFGSDGVLYVNDGKYIFQTDPLTDERTTITSDACPFPRSRMGVTSAGALWFTCGNDDDLLVNHEPFDVEGMELFMGVMADGRLIGTTRSESYLNAYDPPDYATDIAIYDADGVELSRAVPHEVFASSDLVAQDWIASIRGDAAAVAFWHDRDVDPEVLIYNVGSDSEFRLVRRVPLEGTPTSELILPMSDGSLFRVEKQSSEEGRVWRLPPGGDPEVVLDAIPNPDSMPGAQYFDQLLVGPRL